MDLKCSLNRFMSSFVRPTCAPEYLRRFTTESIHIDRIQYSGRLMILRKGHDMAHTTHEASNHCHKQTTKTCTSNMTQRPRANVNHFIAEVMNKQSAANRVDIHQRVNARIDNNVDSQGDTRGGEERSTQAAAVGELIQVNLQDRPARVSEDGSGLELVRAKARIKELTAAAIGGRSVSKNKTRRCLKNLPATDRLNASIVYNFIDDKLWSVHHIRTAKWSRYRRNKKTMCQRILGCGIKIPAGTTEGEYWDTILVMSVNNKYTFNKSNVFEKLKTQHKGNVWAHPFTYPFHAK